MSMMKRLMTFITIMAICSYTGIASPEQAPSGQVVELHACEVYTGGCTASSQATLGGRSLLRVWSFEQGEFAGQELKGLQVALLQVAKNNLAFRNTLPSSSVLYLPAVATDEQRSAIIEWLKLNETSLGQAPLEVTVLPVSFNQNGDTVVVKVGDRIDLRTQSLEVCKTGECGEALWYQPRSKLAAFKVLLNERSTVRESELKLIWTDNGAKSVFLGRFGDLSEEGKADLTGYQVCRL